MKIKNLTFKNNIFLAPMAGVSDVAFRELCHFFGAGATWTEMVSVKGLYYKSKATEELLTTYDDENPKIVQLFGHDEKIFEEVIKSGKLDKFDVIDINMGCPAPKIVKNGDGSALLRDLDLARNIIRTCRNATDKIISVKFRKGYEASDDISVEFAKMCQEAGADFITYHPRTKAQGYSGKVDFEDLKRVCHSVNIPVVASGDIVDKDSCNKAFEAGCKAVMIGRKAVGCPEIFSLLQDKSVTMTKQEIAKLHIKLLKKYFDDSKIVNLFKRHALCYTEGQVGAVEKRKKIALSKTLEEIEKNLFDN